MTTVTIAEASANLADLLRRAAAGEQIVITDEGKWLAALGAPPPPPPASEEIAAQQARAEAQVRLFMDLAAGTERHPGSAEDRELIQRWFEDQRR